MPEALDRMPLGANNSFSVGSLQKGASAFVRDAVACSMDALERFGQGAHLSDFLAANRTSVRNVILMKDGPGPFAAIIRHRHAQLKWGEDAILLDLTKVATLLDYLEAVALFGGELHLMNISLSASETRHFLQLLESSPTPPQSLKVYYGRFCAPSESAENEKLGSEILETVRKNGKIRVLTVAFAFGLDFVDIKAPSPSLQVLMLSGVQVGVKFFEQISTHINSWASLEVLTLSHVVKLTTKRGWKNRAPRQRWQKAFSDLVQNDSPRLKHLMLHGFRLDGAEDRFWDFINALGRNSSLLSLSLADCSHPRYCLDNRASLIASLEHAFHKKEHFLLDLEGTPFAVDPAIEALLVKNKAKPRRVLPSNIRVPATAVRLFICGDSYAGKTTLLSTLSNDHKRSSRLRWFGGASSGKGKRTRGIEVRKLDREGIWVSAWDMAGQEEYHAFHDHIFPDMSAHGAPALFLFVWSPVDSKDDAFGKTKSTDTFEASFRYWLKFIASNTRPSNVARKVIVVITRKDQTELVRDSISTHLSILQNTFQPVIEIASVWEVDARSRSSVGVVASAIFECANSVLKDVEVYAVCNRLILHLATMGLSFLAWEDFQRLCKEKFEVSKAEDQIAIALMLHESGHLIYFRNMPFLVLDTHWFCCKIMGELIHFSGPSSKGIPFRRGFVPQQYLEKLLEQGVSSNAKVSGSQLVDLMEAMHLCCKVPGDGHSNVFIPSSLPESPTLSWRSSAKDESANFFYAGRRLQCRDELITFLTPGIFTVIQVTFNKAFGKIGADIVLFRNLISIYYQCIEIIVEFSKVNGQNVMDILVRSLVDKVDPSLTLKVMEEKVVRAIIRICAEPIGNQGVELVQGVIRLECLVLPALSHEREDQYVLLEQLKENLKLQMQERPQQATFWYTWRHNQYFGAGADSIMVLLGLEEYLDALKSYKSTLQELAKELDAACEHEQILPQEDEQDFVELDVALASIADGMHDAESIKEGLDEEGEDVDKICEGMATSIMNEIQALNSKVDIIDTKLDGVGTNLAAMRQESHSLAMLQGKVLQQIQKNMEQFLFFESEKVVGRVPRLGFLTTKGIGRCRRFVTAFSKDLKSIRIELFCEDKDCPHKVEGQNGIHVTVLKEGAFKSALPYINGFLKLLTMVARVGAHAVAGLGSSVPDLSRIVVLLLDTPGILDNLDGISGFTDANLSFNGWQQWLVHVLQQNGGMTEQNIFSKFKLRRALYKETSQVAWLCEHHYISQTPFPLS